MARPLLLVLVPLAVGCKKPPPPREEPPPSVTPVGTVPPVAPLSAFAEAPIPEGAGTALDRARSYEANGQLWLARLTIEKRALAANASPEETALLARICAAQSDHDCVAGCERKLGKKVDAGAPR
jgi:hypothetical protein